MNQEILKIQRDKYAPYWAAMLFLLWGIGLSTIWIDLGPYWKGYALDMTGPAWNYILFRGLFTSKTDNAWTRFFTPKRTVTVFLIVCVGIETAQYFKLYNATFDAWDFLAYGSILIPLFLIDLKIIKRFERYVAQ
ncbi:MAG: hypothetical protein GXO87_05460 [Chlorobi bacterium]|nr:hypothetical protein [Chlorobiota bacterium]